MLLLLSCKSDDFNERPEKMSLQEAVVISDANNQQAEGGWGGGGTWVPWDFTEMAMLLHEREKE